MDQPFTNYQLQLIKRCINSRLEVIRTIPEAAELSTALCQLAYTINTMVPEECDDCGATHTPGSSHCHWQS
jgi:hypothetical protein